MIRQFAVSEKLQLQSLKGFGKYLLECLEVSFLMKDRSATTSPIERVVNRSRLVRPLGLRHGSPTAKNTSLPPFRCPVSQNSTRPSFLLLRAGTLA